MKLYKFRSIDGEGFRYSLDAIVNERIYLSTCSAMNDPDEGAWKQIETKLNYNYLKIQERLRDIVNFVRFTCFTENVDNELLWAHYAGGFSGIALEYELNEHVYDIRKIKYDGIKKLSKNQMEQVVLGEIEPMDVDILEVAQLV